MEKERKEKERKQSLHWRREYRQLKVVLILAEPIIFGKYYRLQSAPFEEAVRPCPSYGSYVIREELSYCNPNQTFSPTSPLLFSMAGRGNLFSKPNRRSLKIPSEALDLLMSHP